MAQQITYDKAYDAVAPENFPAMLEVPRYGRRSDAFDKIISATHDHFWDPLDKKYIDFDQPFDMADHADHAGGDDHRAALRARVADRLDDAAEDPARQRRHALVDLQSPARRAGRADPVGQPLPRADRPGRAGIRRQPDARGGAPRHRLRQLHHRRWGRAAAGAARRSRRCWSTSSSTPEVYKKIVGMQMLVEGLAMGAFATLQRQDQRSGAAPAGAAGDDRRGLPPQVREDLGRQDHPASERRGAQDGRGLGGALFQMLLFNLVTPSRSR